MGHGSDSHATDPRTLPVKELDPLSMPCMCHAPLSHASTSTTALGGVYPALAPHGSRVSAVRLSLTSPMRGTPWAPKALFGSGRQAQSPKPPHPGGGDSAGPGTPTTPAPPPPPPRGLRPTVSCQRCRPKASMGAEGARCYMNTKGALRKILLPSASPPRRESIPSNTHPK